MTNNNTQYSIPQKLIYPDSQLTISIETQVTYNKFLPTIVFAGTQNGFLTFVNSFNYLLTSIELEIHIKRIPGIQSEIDLFFNVDDNVMENRYGFINKISDIKYEWKLSEDMCSLLASELHGLGYLNYEYHVNHGNAIGDYSVYCCVKSE
jgi:hypothetical protein